MSEITQTHRARRWMKMVALLAFSLLIILNLPFLFQPSPVTEMVQDTPPEPHFKIKEFLSLLSEERKKIQEKPAPQKLHTVVKGDTLTGISKRYYGTAKRWTHIYEANKTLIPDKDNIRTGITLTLP